jgi:RNA polymerase sigma factor (sigma-70 family)
MAEAPLLMIVRQVRRLAGSPAPGGDSDRDLLTRYAALRDAEAFEALVRRHGPMVWNLCRRVLRHEQDAEDAFQATFLVLARQAASVGGKGTLAGWLYRVAFRIALKAKGRGSARSLEPLATDPPCPAPSVAAASDRAEVRSIIDEEVNRLPERFRVAFVLCCLEGRSNAEAAAVLGCPRGTVDSRLSTARECLRQRLTRRGVTLALAASLETQLGADATAASAARVAATVRAALQFTTTGVAAETLTGPAVLANGVLHAMSMSKWKWLAVAVVSIGLVGGGGVATYEVLAGGETPQAADNTRKEPPAKKL